MSVSSRSARASLLLFIVLITVQVWVVLSVEPPLALHGDEGGFVGKALTLRDTGAFPPPGEHHLAVLRGDRWGWSEFKAPGMSVYLLPYLLGLDTFASGALADKELKTARKRLLWAQTVMAVLTTCLVFFFFLGRVAKKKTLAILLGLQPWAFFLVGNFAALVITNLLLATGLYIFGTLVVDRLLVKGATVKILVISVSWSLLVLFRPDYLPVVTALMAVVVTLLVAQGRQWGLVVAVMSIFLLAIAGNVVYRLYMDGELRLYGAVIYPYKGLASWNETWFNDLRTRYMVQGLAKDKAIPFARLPDHAFAEEFERDRIELLLADIESGGYSEQIDRGFSQIAAEKKGKNWVSYFLLPKTWQFLQIVFHTETNHGLLTHLVDWPAGPRRILLGGFHLVKVCMVLLWVLAFPVFYSRYRKGTLDSLDWFGLLLASVAILKYTTVYIGIAITHAGPEGRLLLGGLPAIQGAAAYTLARVAVTRGPG